METLAVKEQLYDRQERMRNDTATWLAEVLDGKMRTAIEYRYDGNELYASDGSALEPIFHDAIQDAQKIAAKDPTLAFELRRRTIEYDEYQDLLEVASGVGANTMVVVSDFPPELMHATKDVGGYNVERKQTMLRVISRQADGTVKLCSQSLDGSDRQALESIYHELGSNAQLGELLGQRIKTDLPASEQEYLVDWLVGVYDRSLAARYGSNWHAGRQHGSQQNTYDFVLGQNDLLEAFMGATRPDEINEHLLYNLAAAMKKRFESRGDLQVETLGIESEQPLNPLIEMQFAGNEARAAGKTFSGCGVSVEASSGEATANGQMAEAGYGNQSGEAAKLPVSIRCINCKEKVSSRDVVKPKSWCCPKCKYEVDICSGRVIYHGKR